MQVTYQKSNGCIIQRTRNTIVPYKIGETTSMGWKVLNIEYEYKNKFYPEYKYNMLIQKDRKTFIKKKQNKDLYMKEIRKLFYYLIVVILVSVLRKLLGI